MTTPQFLTGFENGVATLTTNGSGLWEHVAGSVAVVNSDAHTGTYSLHVNPSGALARCGRNTGTVNAVVGRFYFKFKTSLPSANADLFILNMTDGVIINFRFYIADNKVGWRTNTLDTFKSANAISADTYYCVDFKFTANTNPRTVDWKLNHVDETQYSQSATGTTATNWRIGTNNADTYDAYVDDLVISVTAGDYPIGGTSESGTEALVPGADGTHNAGTNVIEYQDGTDVGTAYDKLNSVPPSATTYIRQAANGTGNYAEVQFGNISATHSAIIGALGILAYTSESTAGNTAGCIMSKDDFATNTVIWGVAGALSDYSDGSTANLFYKSAILANVVDDTTVNALEARVGYSGDANPDPYWIDLIVEVAYTFSSGIPADVTETSSATESPSAAATFTPAQAETASAADTPGATYITNPGRTEALNATDSLEAVIITPADQSEPASAADTTDASFALSADITESTSATESLNATAIFAPAQAEAASAADTPSSVMETLQEQLEPVSAAATESAIASLLAVVAESSPALDVPAAVFVTAVYISESSPALDSISAVAILPVEALEGATTGETISAVAAMPAEKVEAVTALDSPGVTVAMLADLIESANAQDVSNGQIGGGPDETVESANAGDVVSVTIITASGVVETINAMDLFSAVLMMPAAVVESSSAAESASVGSAATRNRMDVPIYQYDYATVPPTATDPLRP